MWGLRTIALLSISSHINMMSVQLPDTITFNIATNWVQGGDMCFFSLDWDKDVLLDFAIYKSMGPLSSGSTSLKNLFGYYIDSYLFICPHFLSKRWEKGAWTGFDAYEIRTLDNLLLSVQTNQSMWNYCLNLCLV